MEMRMSGIENTFLFENTGEEIELLLHERKDKAMQKRTLNAMKRKNKREKYYQKLHLTLLRKHFDKLKTFSINKALQEKLTLQMSLSMIEEVQEKCFTDLSKSITSTRDKSDLFSSSGELVSEDPLKEWEIILQAEYANVPLPQSKIGFPPIWWTNVSKTFEL